MSALQPSGRDDFDESRAQESRSDVHGPEDFEAQLLALPGYRVVPDMHRWFWLRERAGLEQRGLEAIRVTGSNGKGSTCVMLDAILAELGITCGRITSPHLLEFDERIAFAGRAVPRAELASAFVWARRQADDYFAEFGAAFNAYEILVAMAVWIFAERRPELVISEAGKGGRFDPGWVFDSCLGALTSIELEHGDQLGPTTLDVLCHKADICSPGATLVAGPLDAKLLRSLRSYCRMRRVELVSISEIARWQVRERAATHTIVDLELGAMHLDGLRLGLAGDHQVANMIVAVELARRWLALRRPEPAQAELAAAVRSALARIQIPGRFTQVRDAPRVYVDVAHTPDGARALARAISELLAPDPILLVVGLGANRSPESRTSSEENPPRRSAPRPTSPPSAPRGLVPSGYPGAAASHRPSGCSTASPPAACTSLPSVRPRALPRIARRRTARARPGSACRPPPRP